MHRDRYDLPLTAASDRAESHRNEYLRDAQVLSMLLGAFGFYAFSRSTRFV